MEVLSRPGSRSGLLPGCACLFVSPYCISECCEIEAMRYSVYLESHAKSGAVFGYAFHKSTALFNSFSAADRFWQATFQ